jgi:uncharacterized membrane protein YhaH (DUF805 family)
MAIVPKMGRSHFFALYSVVANIAVGISPVLWGLCIDAVGAREGMFLGIEWNRYTVFFAGVFVSLGATLVLARRLHEPAAASMEALLRGILIHSPQRMWLRLWPR